MNPAELADLRAILRWRAEHQPGRLAYTFLADGERREQPLTYAELDRQARAIAAALLRHGRPQDRALLLHPAGLGFVAAFFGCVYANVVAIPVPAHFQDPARLGRTLPRLRAIAQDAQASVVLTCPEVLAHTGLIFEQAPELAALRWLDGALEAAPCPPQAEGSRPPASAPEAWPPPGTASDAGEPPATASDAGEPLAVAPEAWQLPAISPDDLVFLQYSSGSTGTPKGVMVSHANVMHNEAAIRRAFGHDEATVAVSWLPAYHDMGLVADVLQPVYTGFHCVFMSPFDFVARPLRWLEAIARHRATTSGAPNFAYALCANKVTPEELAGLDLRRWTVAYDCAEPVQAEVIDRFVATFAQAGFRREAFFPFLGMAEATLMVTAGRQDAPPPYLPLSAAALLAGRVEPVSGGDAGAKVFVGCGASLPDQALRIVDAVTGAACEDGRIGEIWVAGPSVARGYWRKPEATAETFGARLAGDAAGPFLRTGDLGFLHGGELFITGRLKDLIIIQGQNHYPQDLERSAEASHPRVRPGCSAAFAIARDGAEALVLVAEVTDGLPPAELAAVTTAIQAEIFEAHQLVAAAVVLIPAGTIPKTSSGKIQRRACQEAYLADRLPVVGGVAFATVERQAAPPAPPSPTADALALLPSEAVAIPTSDALAALVADLLGLAHVGADDRLLALGGHSLLATRLAVRVRERFGVELPLREVFQAPTIAALAARIEAREAAPLPAVHVASGPGPWPLSYAQERMWFLEQLQPGGALYVMAALVRLRGDLDVAALRASLQALVERHAALRTRFEAIAGGEVVQVVEPAGPLDVPLIDLTRLPAPEAEARRLAEEAAAQPFDLARAPLLRATLLRVAPDDHLMALSMHHIASDGWSMGVLTHELAQLYAAYRRGEPAMLPAPAVRYADFARWQRGWLRGEVLEGQLAYWRGQLADAPAVLPLPADRPRPAVASFQGASLAFELAPALTEGVRALAARVGATPFMVLLAAFQVLLHRHSRETDICVGVPIANRRHAALEPLVGFFVNTLVIRGDLSGAPSFDAFLGQVRERCLDAYAHQDLPFEKLVEALRPARSLGQHPLFQVMFILQEGAIADWQLEGLEATPEAPPAPTAKFDLTLELVPRAGGLRARLEYSRDLFDAATIARLGEHYVALLEALLADPAQPIAKAPLADLPPAPAPASLPIPDAASKPSPDAALGPRPDAASNPSPDAASKPRPDAASGGAAASAPAATPPTPVPPPARADHAAPQSPEEERLCALFAEVLADLDLPRVDVRASFFDLGGHSLLATRLAARIREDFRIELPLRKLFEAPSVEALAATIRAQGGQAWPAAGSPAGAPHEAPLSTPGGLAPLGRIEPAPRGAPLRLSHAQERLWFMDQLMPGSALYTHPAVFRLKGALDEAALAQGLDALVDRHEPLRTRFEPGPDGQAVQVIEPHATLALERIDLAHLPAEAAEAEAQRLAHVAANAHLDLARAPLMRVALVRLAPDEHLLVLTIHHILVDGWSMGLLLRELGELYGGFSRGAAIVLPALPLQYADYVGWQRAWFGGEACQAQLAYWQAQLAQAPTLLGLPTDRPRPAVERYHGAKRHFQLDRALTTALQELARREDVTPFMLLLAVFQVLLARYSHQTDICVGVPFANRRLKEVEPMLGLFVNTLVLRGDLTGQPSFRAFLRQIKERCLDADAHQDLPFERIVEALNPPRSTSHHPLYQVMFTLQEPVTWALAGVEATPVELAAELSKLDLSLDLVPNAQGLEGRVEYNRDLFDPATIDRLAGHFEALLRAVVAAPDQPVTHLPLLTAAERQQLLVDWNRTQVAYPRDACIHQLIEAQVARTPEAVAVVFEGQALTYAALNARANQLAHHLRAKGVGPDVLVGLCLERSLELVVGVLAILKAGGAYLPLDPGYPAERVRFMRRDAGVRLILAQEATQALLADEEVETLCLDAAATAWRDEPDTNPASGVGLEHLISVIYTSGSTGKPKGVMNKHLGVYNHLVYRQAAYRMTPDDRIIQKTSINFDGSVWELFWPLMVGARLHVLQPAAQMDGQHLCAFIQQHGITMIDFVPSMLHEVLNEGLLQACRSLRRFFVGGESLTYPLARQFFAKLADPALTHGYGPTETTVSVIYYDCHRDDPRPVVPIGRPIANTRLYLLDAHGEPVPVGVPGELHIGGDGLARGYLNRPELTAEKFIADPFVPGERLYRSGDLARYLPDGQVEFLGRVDQQVKIRGFRIELGEIESVLGQHPAIREVVVLAREDRPGDRRLVAYLVAEGGERPALGDLRAHLKAQLPDHMVPAAFVFLERLPLTHNEKVDRRALPPPDQGREQADAAYVAPGSPDEEALCELFSEVLGVRPVGIHDDFFDLGGHSLLATQLVSRIRERLRVELPLRRLFEAPTVAALAAGVRAQQGQVLPPIVRGTELGPQRLSYAQERLWFMDQLEPDSALYNIPAAYRLGGPLDVGALERSFAALLARHDALRTRFVAIAGQAMQVVDPPGAFTLAVTDLGALGDAEAEAVRLARAEAQTAFDLAQGPLLRARLLRLGPDQHVLLLGLHHIVSDGWSWGVMMRELAACYQAYRRGEAPALPALPIQYADYARWQRDWFAGEVFQAQLDYWKRTLAGAPALLQLPTDRPRPAVESYRGARVELPFARDLAEPIQALAQREGVTPFMLLLAAFQVLLHRHSRETDICVGVPIANRRHAELEPLIGFFVNTLVIRGDLAGQPRFMDFLQQLKARCLDAYAHQDLPFEKLVEELNPKRSLSHHPLFQVLFVLQEAGLDAFTLDGLALAPLELGSRLARFDLALELLPGPTGWTARIEYSQDLFDATTIERLLGHYEQLLRAILADPTEAVAGLTLLGDAERRQLAAWNDTGAAYADDTCLHRLFEAQVARTPDAVAAVCGDRQLTYRELDVRANQLAHRLRACGAGPEVLVGLCLERSLELVTGFLGILKAGAAYLPLDPAYPADRLAFMLADARVGLVVAQDAVRDRLPAPAARVIRLEPDDADLAREPREAPACAAGPDTLAYVIYTSGSTGRPKGALLAHRGLCNLVTAARLAYGFGPATRVLQFSSPSFDASVFEIAATLCNGGTLCLGSREELMPGAALDAFIRRHRVGVINLPPSALALMPVPTAETSLETIIVAGEACPVELAAAWARVCRVFNAYGPTEATVWSTVAPYVAGEAQLPIGRPIANTRAWILDPGGAPVPIGVAGELHVGGPGVARGYLDRPELTAEKFIADPFTPGERLYKTGDLARWLPDGRIAFLGRVDHQLKLRGFRVEPGEIAHALQSHPDVREALVMARDEHDRQALTAYVVPGPLAASEEVERERVDQWRSLYQATDGQTTDGQTTKGQATDGPATDAAPPDGADLGSDFTGWNSSYTGAPLPREEMLAWRDATVERIRALAPRRLYEIGCGRGLLLSQLAPGLEAYWASDFSPAVLAHVERQRRQRPELGAVRTLLRTADDFADIAPASFDTIVLNSVAQYFPSAAYLRRVLAQAVRALAPGGHIFVGDVRHLGLLEAFHASVVRHQAPADVTPGEIAAQARQRVEREEELCLAPAFFLDLGLPGLRAEVLPKRGTYRNELNDYRYDVVLHLEAAQATAPVDGPAWEVGAGLANDPVRAQARAKLVPALRAHLAARLPEHMLPGHYVLLEAFPLTPNGKVDRQALPAPEQTRQQAQATYVAPRTPAEATLCALFAEVLGVDRVGLHDGFFELGGHSLLAIQLAARIRTELGTELPLRRLFEAPTPAALAEGLAADLRTAPARGASAAAATTIGRAPANAPRALSHGQAMWWALFPRRAELEHGIQNSYAAIRLAGPLDVGALERAFQAVIARHESLRTTFADIERRPRRVVHAASPFTLASRAVGSEEEAIAVLQRDAQADFDLVRGPLIRAGVYRVGERRHLLMVSVSHLVFDGWSMKILLEELDRSYTACVAGRAPDLPDLPIQYSDYVHWHRRWVAREVIRKQLPYWLLKGRDMPTVLDLPTDKPRPDVLSMAGGSVTFSVPAPLTQALQAMAQREGVTLYMLLLAAFQVLLHRYSGLADIFVGAPVANRPLAETQRLIGLFLNFVVVRGDLSGQPRFRDFLQRVKDACLGAYAHQDLPFQVLLKTFRVYKALTTFGTFRAEQAARSNVMFNLVEDFGATCALGPVQGTLVPLEAPYASQTLHLVMMKQGDGLTGHLIYSADLFHRETIERLARQYQALLESVLADPGQSVSAAGTTPVAT